MSKLTVNFIEYFAAAAYRHLSMHSVEKIKVYILPSEDGAFVIEKEKKEKLKGISFKIEKLGMTSSFKLLMTQNSKCDSLLSSEFINSLIWAVDPVQDYIEMPALELDKESSTFLFHIEIEGFPDECIFLNMIES